jgi:hypothetical protein
MHCWLCETPIRWAFGLGFYCPNIHCPACKWDDPDDDPEPIDEVPSGGGALVE